MRKHLENDIMNTAIAIQKDLKELEQKKEKTKEDNERIAELKDVLYQLRNALRSSWK